MTSYYVYIIRCADGTYYIGSTNNLKKRLLDHNFSRKGAKYTRSRRPVVLMYTEKLTNKSDALKREAMLKKMNRNQKESLWTKHDEVL